MAGGLGVRLRPFTYLIPKALLPLGNSCVLDNMIECLRHAGFDDIYISVHYRADKFEKWLESYDTRGMDIRLIHERNKLGTAGSLFLMKDYLDETFCLINGDLIIKNNLKDIYDFHIANRAEITLGVKYHDFRLPYAIIEKNENGDLLGIREKPTYSHCINTGIYILEPAVLGDMVEEKYIDMPSLIQSARNKSAKIMTYNIGEFWLDMGQISDYEKAVDLLDEWTKASRG